MELHHFLAIAVVMVGILMYINTRSKARKPYRTDYKPQMPRNFNEDDAEMEGLLNSHRISINKNTVEPDALLDSLAKEHAEYMFREGKASHDNSKKRVFIMRTNNAISTGECTADGFRDVSGFLHGYINHKHKTGKRKGQYSHRHIIEGDYTHYGHCMLYGDKNVDILLFAKF